MHIQSRHPLHFFTAVYNLDQERYGDVIGMFEAQQFASEEHYFLPIHIFHKAHLERGKARFENAEFAAGLEDFEVSLSYPESLGAGRSIRAEEAESQYWRGKALQALARLQDARLAWQTGAAGRKGSGQQNRYRQLCRMALLTTLSAKK